MIWNSRIATPEIIKTTLVTRLNVAVLALFANFDTIRVHNSVDKIQITNGSASGMMFDKTKGIAICYFTNFLTLRTRHFLRTYLYIKKPESKMNSGYLCRHRLIFPGRHQPSIVSVNELNYRVRNGNGCTLITINTYYLSLHFCTLKTEQR